MSVSVLINNNQRGVCHNIVFNFIAIGKVTGLFMEYLLIGTSLYNSISTINQHITIQT